MPTNHTKLKKAAVLPVRGDLRLAVRDARSGHVIRRIQIRNTITTLALSTLVRLLAQTAGTATSSLSLATLAVGTGTTPPTSSDTALQVQLAAITLGDVNKTLTLSGPYELRITATLDANTGNGSTISEAGLFTGEPVLFARQIHPAIPKNSALVIDYDWRITFTA